MTKELDIKIGQLLRAKRITKGLSQEQLGSAIGVTFQQVQKYERGLNRISVPGLLLMLSFMGEDSREFIESLAGELPEQSPQENKDTRHVKEFLAFPVEVRGKAISFIKTALASIAENYVEAKA